MTATAKALLVVIALLLVGNGVALATIDSADGAPLAWDPRVKDLASFVEDARHLRFEQPVNVRFLTDAEYAEASSSDESELSDEEKQEIENIEGEMRALGLLSKEASLFEDGNALVSGGTLAFYDPDVKEMVIRGTKLTVGLEVTIVHELTHALQDQHFDLTREFESDNRAALFHALGEGDATRIENEYVDSLSDDDQDAYFDEQEADQEDAEEAIEDVSPFLTQLFAAPYELGAPLTTVVVDTKGVAGLNKLFRNPPATDELLMSPSALLDDAKPVKVARPKLGKGEKFTEGGDFGVVTWYLMLATFIDEKVALNATDGWGGDSFVGYRAGGRSCVRAVFVGDTALDNTEMRDALEQWKAAFGSSDVKITASERRVDLESCEPPSAPKPRDGFDQAIVLPIVRYQIFDEVLASGGTAKLARCAVREFFNRLTLAQLNPQTEKDAAALNALGPQIGGICRGLGEF